MTSATAPGLTLVASFLDHPDARTLADQLDGELASIYGGPTTGRDTALLADLAPPHGLFLIGYLDCRRRCGLRWGAIAPGPAARRADGRDQTHVRCSARAISGLGMAEFRRQVEYKAADAGARVGVADRWYPSSKTCSACGAVRAKLTLAERQFVCEACDTRIDRDLNAAMNLARLADEVTSGASCARTENEPAGNPCKTAMGGNGYRHGKAPLRSQRCPREVATP